MARNSSSERWQTNSDSKLIHMGPQRLNSAATRTAMPAGHEVIDTGEVTATMFLDFDGTLHIGRASMDEQRVITLDSGRPPFEFAPLLIELLEPYPAVQLVLTTSWLMTLTEDEVVALMPQELGRRVVGTTRYVSSRLSYILNGTDRTYVIWKYASGKRLKHWLAVDDSVFGADEFGRTRGELVPHYLLLHSLRGLSDGAARQRIAEWLTEVHG